MRMFSCVNYPVDAVVNHEAAGGVRSNRSQGTVVVKDQEDEIGSDTDQKGTEHIKQILGYLHLSTGEVGLYRFLSLGLFLFLRYLCLSSFFAFSFLYTIRSRKAGIGIALR